MRPKPLSHSVLPAVQHSPRLSSITILLFVEMPRLDATTKSLWLNSSPRRPAHGDGASDSEVESSVSPPATPSPRRDKTRPVGPNGGQLTVDVVLPQIDDAEKGEGSFLNQIVEKLRAKGF